MSIRDVTLRPGELRHRITFLTLTKTPDAGGGRAVVEHTEFTVWADIRPASRNEVFEGEQVRGTVTHDVLIRDSSEVQALNLVECRISFDTSRRFEVLAVARPAERGALVRLRCREVPYDG